MRDLTLAWTWQLAAALSTIFLLALGCDLSPSDEYSPPGEDHEVAGQVLWTDVHYYTDDGYDFDPGLDPCNRNGRRLHSSRLEGTERKVRIGAPGTTEHAVDVALHRSSGDAYWAVYERRDPSCPGGPENEVRIERVSLDGGWAETVYKIDYEPLETPDREISDLAVGGTHLVWAETTSEGDGETTAVLSAPLPTEEFSPEEDSLRPDTAHVTSGEVEAIEAGSEDGMVYWNTSGGRLFRTDLGGETTLLSNDFSGQVEAIGGNPARIYWRAGAALRSIGLDGTGQRRSGTLPEETTAIALGPRGQKVFAGTEGEDKEDEGIWVAPLSNVEASAFDKCVGEGKSGETISGDRHREDFRSPQSLAVLYDENG